MATATGTAPIDIGQINSTYYVTGWGAGFSTVQQAVDNVRVYGGGIADIVVVQGHDIADNIATVTGGHPSTFIIDQREGRNQKWMWNGTAFIPEDFAQLGGISGLWYAASSNIPFAYDGHFYMDFLADTGRLIARSTTTSLGHIQLEGLSNEADGRSVIYLDCIEPAGGGEPQSVFNTSVGVNGQLQVVRGAHPDVADLWLGSSPIAHAGAKGMYVWTKTAEDATDLQGITYPATYDQTLRLNYLGGHVLIGKNAVITESGHLFSTALNNTYFVGNATYPTIQSAVDRAVTSNNGVVIIPWDYAGSDTIEAVTNGRATVIIKDHTNAAEQAYIWSGSQYVPANFDQFGGAIFHAGVHIEGNAQIDGYANLSDVNITGDTNQTGDFRLAGNAWMGRLTAVEIAGSTIAGDPAPITIIGDETVTGHLSADSAAFNTCLVAGSPVRTFANTPDGGGGSGMEWPPAGIGVSTGTAWGTSIDPATVPRLNTANSFTGSMTIDGTLAVGAGGTQIHDLWISTSYSGLFFGRKATPFGTTFEIRLDNAIPASYIDSWGELHINSRDTSLTHFWGSVDAKVNLTVGGLSTFNANLTMKTGTSITTQFIDGTAGSDVYFNWYKGTGVTFGNGAGLAVARVDAAGKYAIPAAVVADATPPVIRLDLGINNVSGTNYPGSFQFTTENSPSINADLAKLTIKHYSGDASYPIRDIASFSRANTTITSNTTKVGHLWAATAYDVYDHSQNGFHASLGSDFATPYTALVASGNPNYNERIWETTIFGQTMHYSLLDAAQARTPYLSITRANSTVAAMSIAATVLTMNGNFKVTGDFSVGAGGNFSVNLSTGPSIDCWSVLNCHAGLNTTGGTKNFVIPHPLDDTKELTHSCLEGPEAGVFYRGEVTTANGIAEVTLPDYFEALTFTEDRSILLTVIVDDANPVFGGQVAAGRITNGKFKVYSVDPSATIAWEVKAIRRIDGELNRLKVVTDRTAATQPQPIPQPREATFENAAAQVVEAATQQEKTDERKQRNPKRA